MSEVTGKPNTGEDVAWAISELKKGILSRSRKRQAAGFRVLYKAGAVAIEPLVCELQRIDLEQIGRPESTALFNGLASILHDISEDASLEFIDAALARNCHPVNKAVLNVIGRFRRSDFREKLVAGIEILESKAIDERYRATSHVSRWLGNVPDNDLRGISRIYIIDADLDQDFLGYYLPSSALITIVWLTFFHPSIPVQWAFRLSQERTLYHEIGHHKHGHTEGGQVPEQELEADRYSRKLMRKSHPRLRQIGVILGRVFRRRKLEKPSSCDV